MCNGAGTVAGVLFAAAAVSAVLSLAVVPVQAQGAAEPWEAGCRVTGLDPNGDGFLSIRTGPKTNYREIARVRNGDALFIDMRKCDGRWCLAEGGVINGRQADINGWFFTAWCEMYP